MFLRSPRLCAVRNRALTFATLEQLIGPLIADLRRPI
jgi:hypothetical protein